jgi:hypothetical protein
MDRLSPRSETWVGFAAIALLAALLPGCHAGSPLPAAHATPSARRTVSAPASSAGVQSLPAYRKAQAECAHGRFQQAAGILARLEQSASLTDEERAFCRTQEAICLGHLRRSSPAASLEAQRHGENKEGAGPIYSLTGERGPESSTGVDRGLKSSSADNHRSAVADVNAGRAASDCGPRALLLACDRLGVRTSLAALTKAAGTNSRGTSLAGLKRAAESLHLNAEGLQTGREALPGLPMPAIAWVHGDHYVAVLALSGRGESGTATVHDPNEPTEKTASQESLLQDCGGYLLTLSR